jgi:hypothetical protein
MKDMRVSSASRQAMSQADIPLAEIKPGKIIESGIMCKKLVRISCENGNGWYC